MYIIDINITGDVITLVKRKNGNHWYVYDVHYLKGKTKTTYIGPADQIKIVGRVKDNPRLSNSPCYKKAHKLTNEDEIKEYGIDRFNQLNREMREKIPKGEFAGMNYTSGNLTASGRLDPKFYGQILFHERKENQRIAEMMKRGKKCF